VLGVEIGTLATIEALESVRVLLAHAQAEAKARRANGGSGRARDA
jgi:hypothetical protein